MCYNSILIKSNANRLTYGNRPYMFVPCNKCFACRSARSDSYYIRTVNEMKSFNKDVLALFVLLTYNEELLPRIKEDDFCDVTEDLYNVKSRLSKNSPFEIQDDGIIPSSDFNEEKCYYLPLDQIKVHHLPCFDVSHIDLFFKHLRSYLKRHFGYVPKISYFLVAENGDRYKRPHYHIILFIDVPHYSKGIDNVPVLRRIIQCSWAVRQYVQPYECHRKDKDGKFMYYKDGRPKTYLRTTKMVSLGMTSLGKPGSPQFIDMSDMNAVSRYLSEYLVNDPYFEDVHKANLDQLSPRNKKIYYKKFGPFRLTSQFYGISALERLTDNDILNCIVRLDGKDHPYPMPTYYQRYVYERKITYQIGYDHEKFYHKYSRKKSPYRSHIAYTPYRGYGIRYLPLSQNVEKITPIYRTIIDKNENWKLMKKHKFTELYSSLLSSFGDFRAWLLNDSSDFGPSAFYFEYLMSQPAFNDLLFRCRCQDSRWYQPNLKSLRLWSQLISPRKLLGYYLVLFNFYTYDKEKDPFTTPKALYNINYTREHLDDDDFIRSCYEDFIDQSARSHYLDREVDANSRKLDTWQFRYEYLCICFQSYQHFRLFKTNENKVADWNDKAKSLGKAKFIIQPH